MSLPTIYVNLSGTHELTIGQIAKAFCDMDAEQQVFFFEQVNDFTRDWHRSRAFQWQYIRDEIDRTRNEKALTILRELAEYSQ